jgi:DNA ligase-associated metallophosphoesterase
LVKEKPSFFAEVQIKGESLKLSPQKFAWWESERILFVADCHFGKIAHFRKSGFGIPNLAGTETFAQIHQILLEMKPLRLVILGDIFHSEFNLDFERFGLWRKQFPQVVFDLVLGNHDKAGLLHLNALGLNIYRELSIGPFFCTHEPNFKSEKGFNLCGHIHPGVSLFGIGRQHLKLPCFWKGDNHLCFPSFGVFTGCVAVKPNKLDQLFAISGTKIRMIEGSTL